uniref:Kinesin family member 26Bb n=1 Tax=Sinocyclocheilus anshuiensis TaxID=1608454 RepID=A0A671PXU2_9TELE
MVKVMLRVCSVPMSDPSQSYSFKLDLHKKQITVLNVPTFNPQRQTAGTTVSSKTFTFDAAFGPDSTQAEVCENSLCEVLQSVLAGADGCILSFGQTSVGMSYTMIGQDGCTQSLGVIPCAISWLFKLINRKKDKTWANISVSVSAVEVCGENNAIRDLLSDVDTDNCKKTQASVDHTSFLCNHSLLNAPTPERAAFLLDAALASRSGMVDSGGRPPHCCHMFFTLHVCQQHIGSSTKSGSEFNCFFMGSKLAMLLQDSLSNVNCSTTIIAHISTLSEDLTESLCTMQTVTRMRSQKKKIRKSSSSSPGGRSLGNERKCNNSTKLRFQSTGTLDQDLSSPGFSSDPAFYPGSDTSCDTIISVDPSGLLDKEVTNRSREVLPIIPSLLKKESTPTILQDKSDFECLKCNTFAELQNRLGNIDGTESDLCKDQEVNAMSKSPHLSQTEKQSNSLDIQASNNRESNSTRQGNSSKTFAIIHNSEETPSTANSQIIQKCLPQLDVVKPIDPMLILDDSTMQSETRISPIGKSSPRSTSSSSFSSSLSSSLSSPPAVSASLNEDIPHCTGKKQREMRATITVTVQKPLDLNGHDELVYTVVEEVTINGATEQGKAQILSIHESHSLQALTPGSQSVRIIGSIGEEQTASFYSSDSNKQISENDVSTASSDAAVKHTKINAHIDKASDFIDSKNLPQHDTWSEVPLTKDVKEIRKGAIVKLDPPCEVSKSRKYACEIKPEQSWMCQNNKRDVKDVPHMKTEQKNPHSPRETYEKKQYTKKDSLVEWTKDNMPSTSTNSPNLKRKETKEESGIARSAMLYLATEPAPVSQSSWSTLSLSRSQDNSGLKSPGAVRKGRAELLRSSRDSLSAFSQGGSDLDECEELGTMKPFVHTLPSPYSRITAPRTPHHCSGHASDTTSVLSGELPPAMCKTALLYNRSSMVSSGYESMLRDSEATISSSSTHNSISDQSCSLGAAKGMRSTKKRTNIGSSLRRPSQDNLLSLKRSVSGPKTHWVDRGGSDSYEIKVYEIDNVDGVQKRGGAGNKGIVLFSAKLKFLEHRQQRIAEVRLKYNALRRELEHAKHHLMLDPGKWTREFDLWQTFEVDSLEHLEALEQVTQRLERHVNLCKAHVLMVTSFGVTPKCRQKLRHRPTVDHAAFVGI